LWGDVGVGMGGWMGEGTCKGTVGEKINCLVD
jgi:hypothetical protein